MREGTVYSVLCWESLECSVDNHKADTNLRSFLGQDMQDCDLLFLEGRSCGSVLGRSHPIVPPSRRADRFADDAYGTYMMDAMHIYLFRFTPIIALIAHTLDP